MRWRREIASFGIIRPFSGAGKPFGDRDAR
jgi:hypothetical protein